MFEIYLTAQKPTTIILNGIKINITKTDSKVLKFDEAKALNFDHYFTNFGSNIFHTKLNFIDGEYVSNNQNVQVVKIKDNLYFLKFLHQNECFLQKKCKKIVKNGQLFTFYQNGVVEIETENSILFSAQYDFEIVDANILELKNNYLAIELFGKEENEKSVILNNQFAEILSFDSSVIENTENGFKVLTNLFDIANHGLVEVFEIEEEIKKIDEYSVFMNNAPRREFSSKVLPIYFLQCIRARDYAEAKRCLSPNLKAKAKIEHISQYFGDFLSIFPLNNKIYLEYVDNFNHHFAKPFDFIVENNKIQNIG